MAKCKICGTAVQVAPVLHHDCWQAKIENFAEAFCDNFCRWPDSCKDEEDLQDNHCEKNCPMASLLDLFL